MCATKGLRVVNCKTRGRNRGEGRNRFRSLWGRGERGGSNNSKLQVVYVLLFIKGIMQMLQFCKDRCKLQIIGGVG